MGITSRQTAGVSPSLEMLLPFSGAVLSKNRWRIGGLVHAMVYAQHGHRLMRLKTYFWSYESKESRQDRDLSSAIQGNLCGEEAGVSFRP